MASLLEPESPDKQYPPYDPVHLPPDRPTYPPLSLLHLQLRNSSFTGILPPLTHVRLFLCGEQEASPNEKRLSCAKFWGAYPCTSITESSAPGLRTGGPSEPRRGTPKIQIPSAGFFSPSHPAAPLGLDLCLSGSKF